MLTTITHTIKRVTAGLALALSLATLTVPTDHRPPEAVGQDILTRLTLRLFLSDLTDRGARTREG